MTKYEVNQDIWVKKHNVHVGSFVKVTRKSSYGEKGWETSWVNDMNLAVDTVCKVIGIASNGVELQIATKHGRFWYPYFVLEPTIGYNGNRKVEKSLNNLKNLL